VKVTIAYVTGRKDPHPEWVLAELSRQAKPGDEIEFLMIDFFGRTPRQLGLDHVVGWYRGISSLIIRQPKPTIWQGPHRITSCDWWGMSNSRNTAFCLAKNDYIAFLDDRLKIGPEWLSVVREGERTREAVLLGAYYKYDETGMVGVDDRLGYMPDGMVDCGGGRLYGCTFSLPLAWALDVNGFEEGCDGLSAEDYTFGQMLGNAGYRCDFVPKLLVHEDRSTGHANTFKRADKGVSPDDKSHAALYRFGVRRRTEFTPDLTYLRGLVQAGHEFPIPDPNYEHRDWYDNQLISEL